MIVLIVFILLFFGAIVAYWLPTERRTSQIAISAIPVAALAILLLRLPLPDSFTIPWSPSILFPEPLVFRAGPHAVLFAEYLCGLLFLIEWTRPLRRSSEKSSRVAIYLLALSGVVACSAVTPLAVILVWSWIDFSSFLITLYLKRPVEIGPDGISSPLFQFSGILAVNILGSILVLFSLFTGSNASPSDLTAVGGASARDPSTLLFLTGIALRLVVAPLQFTASRSSSMSTDAGFFLRIVSPAAVLCFLSDSWASLPLSSSDNAVFPGLAVLCALTLGICGWQWCTASSPLSRRDLYFPIVGGMAFLSALLFPRESGVFAAAGAMLILGGGVLLAYIGYLPHRRWMAAFPLSLGAMFAGFPPSPMTVWSASVLPQISASAGLASLASLALIHMLVLCGVFRTAFDPVEEFPSNEPLFLIAFSIGAGVCLSLIFLPDRAVSLSLTAVAVALLLLLGGIVLLLAFGRLQRAEGSFLQIVGRASRLELLKKMTTGSFEKSAFFVSGLESFLGGEGALLWSLGIALLLYLVFRGG
ncbi:MAG: hypothetical protein ACK2UB_01400 [Anaerolineales bacterium]